MDHHRRTQKTLTGLILIVSAIVCSRPSAQEGLSPDTYWAQKALWKNQFDTIIMGDSRVYRGIAPAVLRKYFPGQSIANYGFSGVGLTPDYLNNGYATLDRTNAHPQILLGVTPTSLMLSNRASNGFTEIRRQPYGDLILQSKLGSLIHQLRPVYETDFRPGYIFYPDGWVSSAPPTEDPSFMLPHYEKQFRHEQVSAQALTELSATLTSWTAKGARVYVFRPPSCQAMRDLEDAASGFDAARVAQLVTEAGASWLSTREIYPTYDGTHLREDGARAFSKDLATLMLESDQTRLPSK